MFRNALKLGVPIAFGTDSAISPHGQNAHVFALMVELGMTPAAALLSATRKAGKVADVIALPGTPLETITATEHPIFVTAEGAIYP